MLCIAQILSENCTTLAAVQGIYPLGFGCCSFRELLGGPGRSFELYRASVADSFNEYSCSNLGETVLSG